MSCDVHGQCSFASIGATITDTPLNTWLPKHEMHHEAVLGSQARNFLTLGGTIGRQGLWGVEQAGDVRTTSA